LGFIWNSVKNAFPDDLSELRARAENILENWPMGAAASSWWMTEEPRASFPAQKGLRVQRGLGPLGSATGDPQAAGGPHALDLVKDNFGFSATVQIKGQ
jgi:hypothetical protein